ncbi:MAG TPA: L-2-hydroxyglutarate oxidase [Terriglobales bacterium]|nr:L-2-hydroxyglutarate oxidase [Terriglobales bacterium]
MPDERIDVAIIGAGIVGLSTALHAVRNFPRLRVAVVEKEARVASHQSGHNSGVIHSGIYYRPGSLKARLCVEGAAAMVAFCREHAIPHAVCGKVVVATRAEELPHLDTLWERSRQNGLAGVRMLTREELREVEPHAAGLRALHVPSTGITDYAAVSQKYADLVQSAGGMVLTSSQVLSIRQTQPDIVLETRRDAIHARFVINCAGLFSDAVGRMAGDHPQLIIVPFRGEYYDLRPEKQRLVRALIYPVPNPQFPFLGVHFTRRIHGGVDAGPNAVLAFKREGYQRSDFDLGDTLSALRFPGFWRMACKHWRFGLSEFHRSYSKTAFVHALRRLLPEVTEDDLVPGGSGVRAQALRPDGSLVDDFEFVVARNFLHVYNVPSPAATASLPIGREIVTMARKAFSLS